MGWALRISWLWLQKTNAARPWEGLPVIVPRNAQALFAAAIQVEVGSSEDTLFWTDRWLQGSSLAEIAPNLVMAISKRARKQRTVSQALTNRRWVTDIRGALTVQVLVEIGVGRQIIWLSEGFHTPVCVLFVTKNRRLSSIS
ncbi:hypothetical protein U9M48_023835 [Paspalum notatum var. saurae]|uniref:Uncharacterized protein n=1 Tax=Paspalum notatum var. saurae TaxID=547442 RepID=A0AAQ3TPJ4_PASNO